MAKTTAERVSSVLLEGFQSILEDRVEDLTKQYANAQPPITRQQIEKIAELDPTANKKYLAWIVKQVANRTFNPAKHAMQMKDDLMSFERILRIPAYRGTRDIYALPTYQDFHDLIEKNGTLRSRGEEEREKREKGVEKVAQVGNLELLKITNSQSLIHWAWRAYDPATNPNWKKAKVSPKTAANGEVVADLSDHLWCVRFPSYANSYLSGSAFYLVLKNGGPYAGIMFEKGECQDLFNNYNQSDHQMSMKQVEEIYPVLRDIIPSAKALNGRCHKLAMMRFVHGDVKDGETIQGDVDLGGTSIKSLPNNLTVKGSLDISNTQISHLPHGLKVERTLKIQGTPITDLPDDLNEGVADHDMEWSEPLTWQKVKHLFYLRRHVAMEQHFLVHDKVKGGSPEVKAARWAKLRAKLLNYFQNDPEVDRGVRAVYRQVPVSEKGKE